MDPFEGLLRKSAACCWSVVQMGLDGWFSGTGLVAACFGREAKNSEEGGDLGFEHDAEPWDGAGTEMDPRTCGEWTRLDGGMDRSTRHQPQEGSGVAADRLGKQGGSFGAGR